MLINKDCQFIKVPFDNEAELENVVITYSEQIFGSSIIYLPQTSIKTLGGKGTIPDAIIIDFEVGEWYIVEAERAVHGTWEHIAPQISKQLAAVESTETRDAILQLSLKEIKKNHHTKSIFKDLGIRELDIHGKIHQILKRTPIVAIPIDAIPKDLKEWARTLRNTVKIWLIEKYVCTSDEKNILYSIPDEISPTLTTQFVQGKSLSNISSTSAASLQDLVESGFLQEGQEVYFDYGPRGREKQRFVGYVHKDGIEVDGKIFSPSYAALHCIRQAGSPRTTANGWVSWKTDDGKYLDTVWKEYVMAELEEHMP